MLHSHRLFLLNTLLGLSVAACSASNSMSSQGQSPAPAGAALASPDPGSADAHSNNSSNAPESKSAGPGSGFATGVQPAAVSGINLLDCGPGQNNDYGCGIDSSVTHTPITAAVSGELVTVTYSDGTSEQPTLTTLSSNPRFLVSFNISPAKIAEVSGVTMSADIAGEGSVNLPLPQASSLTTATSLGSTADGTGTAPLVTAPDVASPSTPAASPPASPSSASTSSSPSPSTPAPAPAPVYHSIPPH